MTIRHKAVSDTGSQYIVKFFDPNKTNRYLRVMSATLETLSTLGINNLLTTSSIQTYFKTESDEHLYTPVKCDDHDALVISDFDSLSINIHYALSYNLPIYLQRLLDELVSQDITSIKQTLDALSRCAVPAFFYAMEMGYSDTVAIFLRTLLTLSIPSKDKLTLAYGEDQYGFPGMLVALWYGHLLSAGQVLSCLLCPKIPTNSTEDRQASPRQDIATH